MKKTDRNRIINGCAELVFLGFLAWWLAGMNADYLYMTQELSLFLPTRLFVEQFWQEPGFLLAYGAKFLTQFFYYPWLGTGIYLLLVLVAQALIKQAFRLHRQAWASSFVLLATLTAGGLSVGYMIYCTREPETLFKQMLGLLLMLGMIIFCRGMGKYKWGWLSITAPFVYMLAGAYAWIAVFFAILLEWNEWKMVKEKWGTIAGVLLWTALFPWLFYWGVYRHTPSGILYTAGLPILILPGKVIGSYLVWFLLCLLFLVLGIWSIKGQGRILLPAWGFALIGSVYILYAFSWQDQNFHRELAMHRAIGRQNWKELPELYRGVTAEPTRFMVLAKNLGFYRLGVAGEQMFTLPDGTSPANASFDIGLQEIGGEVFYYHYGILNYAYRWGMEKLVKWGPRVCELKLLAKCALLQGQNELALKYLGTLESVFFHRPWAAYYLPFAKGEKKLEEDPEFRSILPLCQGENFLDNDRQNIEIYLLDQLSFLDASAPEAIEASLLANMLEKNELKTGIRFRAYAAHHRYLPRHYQEAALLFAFINGEEPEIERFDVPVLRRFQAFMRTWQKVGKQPGKKEEPYFRKDFKGTYWYYYLFGPEVQRENGQDEAMGNPH